LKWVCDQDSKDLGCVEVEIEKCRGGKTGSFFLSTDFAYMQMNDVTQSEKATSIARRKETGDSKKKSEKYTNALVGADALA